MKYVCPLCGNKDEKYFGYKNGEVYCRKCISFRGEEALNNFFPSNLENEDFLNIDYKLSDEQLKISDEIVKNFKNGINTLVYAVCGAGKTELTFEVIRHCFKENFKVAFAIPRKDVVIELAERFKLSFPRKKIVSLYGGNTETLEGDLIVLTTHQLYRYSNYFDLLILDEIDAFPYKDNEVLYAFFKRSIKGQYVLMSATPSKKVLDEFSKDKHAILKLFVRFHRFPLPIPKIYTGFFLYCFYLLGKFLNKFIKEEKPVLVFSPTIKETESLYKFLKILIKNGDYVHSKRKKRQEIIQSFRKRKLNYLVTTSVLERGVTLKNLQVIIFHADSYIYNESALIQISGRVGRKKDFPKGEVIYISKRKTKDMVKSIQTIKEFNKSL